MNFAASAIVAVLAAGLLVLAWHERSLWLAIVTSAGVVIGAWMMYRSLVMRIYFDAESLHVVGLFRTRRIPRSAVIAVERADLEWPMVRWALPNEKDRWSVLTPVALRPSVLLPSSMYRRRHRFLAALRRWAPEVNATHVRPGWWSRFLDVAGIAIETLWKSPTLRVPTAVITLTGAALVYWLGCVYLLDAAREQAGPQRGIIVPVFVSGIAAELAYWLLPIKRRHPRAWHIALGVLLAPLAALTMVAILS